MLAYRNPSNEDSDNIFRYTLKLNAYALRISRKNQESRDPLYLLGLRPFIYLLSVKYRISYGYYNLSIAY